jgi:hypothetical protein
MRDTYNKQCEDACQFDVYGSTSKVGKKETGFFCISEIPKIKQMEAELRYFKGFINAFQGMMKTQLETNGVKGTKSAVGEVYKMLDNMEVILKGEEVQILEFGALGKYVTAYVDATNKHIHHGELPEGFSADGTWFKNDQGVYERDMKRAEEAMS